MFDIYNGLMGGVAPHTTFAVPSEGPWARWVIKPDCLRGVKH